MNKHHLSVAILAHHQIEDLFFSSISRMYQHISEDVRAYVTGVETHALNFLLVTDNHAQTAEDLQRGIRLLNERNDVPFAIFAVEPDSQILAVLQQAGFVFDADSITTAMRLDLMNWQMSDVSAGRYEIQCVDHCLGDWAIPIESAFETGSPISGQYQKCHQAALDAGKCLQHYALYVDGQPSCALTLSRLDNIVRLDDIGTVVEQQGKGYAFALINHVLNEARQQGATACYLDASCDGNGLYQRIGFKLLFEYQGFIRE
ncbi:GNAT family N-acetyltransferase [Xenorhabdus lircayensis]|uniref:GNAT family N-acetyltransferase n=1 Tax=Xenorhabdus lircayensis TaxID=2763499 RepID=A0ABS0U4K9_9GAMM|nr:GNAT family N-acetyltransferase [Xenorhabdus lircayensis]MBI6548817.1 GNAT family N-acetyltransferase [Xenorhabdus lircayensis]